MYKFKKMTYINYKELNPNGDYPFMRDSVSEASYSHKELIIAYLRKGTIVLAQLSRNIDVFTGELIGTEASVMTDGRHYWSNQLAYYVDKYNLRLPAEFEKFILAFENK